MLKTPMARATMHAKTAVSLPCPIISALLWLCSCFKFYTSPNACNLTNKFFGHNYWNHWFKNVPYVCSFQIPGVPEDTQFAPRTQREIRDIQWFPIAGLPNSKKEEITDDPVLNPFNVSFNNLFMVMPFVSGIRRWISKKFNPGGRNGRKESSKNSIRCEQH